MGKHHLDKRDGHQWGGPELTANAASGLSKHADTGADITAAARGGDDGTGGSLAEVEESAST
jgi:hypothetical protein